MGLTWEKTLQVPGQSLKTSSTLQISSLKSDSQYDLGLRTQVLSLATLWEPFVPSSSKVHVQLRKSMFHVAENMMKQIAHSK